jgi:MFS superfamily sulfate permease-like transporter
MKTREDLSMSDTNVANASEKPTGNLAGLFRYIRYDVLSGFLVFLIALPLSLGIASASGFPPIAGIFTAIIGGFTAMFLSNSELTIKGPAAGLIVIVIGCVQDFGGDGILGGWSQADQAAYRLTLGVAVAAAAIQILFAVLRIGVLGEFFPTAPVHGLLAAIGVIIIAKQVPVALGIEAKGDPLPLLLSIPQEIVSMNPEVALIGGVSLLILFSLPWIKSRWVKMIPAPMVVVLVAVPMGMYFDLDHKHTYTFGGFDMGDFQIPQESYEIDPDIHEVNVPDDMLEAITFPDFSGLLQLSAWKWVFLFSIIGTLESMLSAKAIDSMDPWKRKTNLDRDNLAIGVGNLLAALVGGLPMISEIVRSRANTDNGARTRFANFFHGLFLLLFVASVPWLIHRIPMAALGAMLVYTGIRLASPSEFIGIYRRGRGQFLVFVVTLVAVLGTDLLKGIAIGIAAEFVMHLLNYWPVRTLFFSDVWIENTNEKTCVVHVRNAAVFSNWISLRRRMLEIDPALDVNLDFSETYLVDHTVMEKLHELEKEFAEAGRQLHIIGLENHQKSSEHPAAARRKLSTNTTAASEARSD